MTATYRQQHYLAPLFFVALSLAAANPVFFAAAQTQQARTLPRITEEYTVEPDASLSPQERRSLSRAAGRILLHVDRARDALALRNVMLDEDEPDTATAKEDALTELEQALKLVAIVEAAAPRYQVTSTLWAGDAEYS